MKGFHFLSTPAETLRSDPLFHGHGISTRWTVMLCRWCVCFHPVTGLCIHSGKGHLYSVLGPNWLAQCLARDWHKCHLITRVTLLKCNMKIISCYWQIWGWTPCPTLCQARPSCQLSLAPAFLWTLISHLAPHCAPGPLHLPNFLCVRHAPVFHFLLILLEPWSHLSWEAFSDSHIWTPNMIGGVFTSSVWWVVWNKPIFTEWWKGNSMSTLKLSPYF